LILWADLSFQYFSTLIFEVFMRKFLFLTMTALLGAASSAHANEVTGVTCPAGYNAVISNGQKKLVCEKIEVITLDSHCGIGSMDSAGSDTCLPIGAGNRKPSGIFGWIPGVHPPMDQFRRVVVANGPDKFTANQKVYAYPEGAVYVGMNPSRGVSCPGSFDGDKRDDGRGIRCDKVVANNVAADCDNFAGLGWTLEVDERGNQDLCVGGGSKGPTKPRGMTKAQFDIEDALPQIKWHLSVNNGPDKWKKKEYAFPKAN
jgi:hypothetical protein